MTTTAATASNALSSWSNQSFDWMKKPLLSGRFFLCLLFACRGSLNPPNPLCKGGTGWFRDVRLYVFFLWGAFRLDYGFRFYCRFAPHPVGLSLCKGELPDTSLLVFVWLCTRVALRFPLCKGGQGGFEDPLCASDSKITLPNQIKTSFPPFGGNCSIIPWTTPSGSLRTSLSKTLIILRPMACICLSLSASRFVLRQKNAMPRQFRLPI